MKNSVKAIVFEQANEVIIREFELAGCGPDDVVVKTLYSMVSSGTELRVLSGKYESKDRFPLIPGYSIVGEVVQIGEQVRSFKVGDLVSGRDPIKKLTAITCLYGGQVSMHVYPSDGEARPVLLPPGCNPKDYAITETAAISLRGIDAADPQPGETAVVLGQGIIGAFSGVWLNARGCRVIAVDLDDGRLERAWNWGASATVKVVGDDAVDRINLFDNQGADIVVESSGTIPGVLQAYRLIRNTPMTSRPGPHGWPRLVMQASYREQVTIDPFKFFNGKGVTVITPQDRGLEERQKVVDAIRRRVIDPTAFIQKVVPFQDAAPAYAALRDDKTHNFSLIFDWTNA